MGQRLIAKHVQLWESEPLILVARIETAGGTPITTANVSSFSVTIFNVTSSTTPAEPVYQLGAIDPALGYYDTLQHDDAENLLGDSGGYNFKYIIAADEFSFQGSNTYRVQIVSQIGGSSHVQVYNVHVGEVF